MKRVRFILVALAASSLMAFADAVSPLVLFTAMTGRPGEQEAVEYFEAAWRAGFGQLMLYPRSGLELDYMGEEWLSFVGHCLMEAKSRGMKAWLYDEYNWPSGSCKGRVPMENPEWTYTEYAVREASDGSFAWEVKRNDQLSMYDKYFDVNAYSTEAIRRFIELTHKTYEKRFSAYLADGTISGIFTDEPAHPSTMKWDDPKPVVTFRWWKELEDQYRARTGRDFRADVEESLRDPSKTAVWETYTELKGRQFRRAYFDPIAEWARTVGIETCGHMIAEGSPQSACNFNGLPLNTLRGLTMPGMDKIGFDQQRDSEWLTYATAQYAIEHNSTPEKDVLDAHGGIELFALGPCDISIPQMAQRIWLAALYGMDTYFMSLYHTTARGFLEKGDYAMFTSPTQPWFTHCGDLHAAARKAAIWSRKKFVRDVAVRYPQRVFGRLALKRFAPGEKVPPFKDLVVAFAWEQVPFELVQDDEKSNLPFVFSFSREGRILEEKSGQVFASPDETLAWLRDRRTEAWRVTDGTGAVVPGLLVRRYADGSAAVLNMTERTLPELTLEKGSSAKVCFALPACGVRLFAKDEEGWEPKNAIGDVAGRWTLSRDRDTLRRIWFTTNNTARLVVKAPIKGVRWLLCDYPKGSVKVTLDGSPIEAQLPGKSAPYGYVPIYRETPPMDLSEGIHELALDGRADDSLFLPVLWLAGDFAAEEPDAIGPAKSEIPKLAPLAELGFQDFAGVATYRTKVKVPEEAGALLTLETGGLPARVRLGGRDLGEKALLPLEWEVPPELAGRELPIEVEVATSVRPVFGRDDVDGVKLRRVFFSVPTQANAARSGLCSAKWCCPGRRTGVRVVVPTPAKMSLTGEEMATDGFEVSGEIPPYACEAGRTLFSGKTPLDFRYDAALGPQAYRLSIRRDGVRMAAGDASGAIYAVQTLRQLVRKLPGGKFAVALGEVDDKPAFSVRGINWNMFVEVRSWSMDDGRGVEDFKRRFIAGLDTMSFFKLNAVIVDGLGWNPERFPGYGALMKSLAHEARRRGIRLGFAGYSEGYGAMWLDSDGPKFDNIRNGRKYPCFGLTGSPQRACGTCLSNPELMEAKKANLRAFVAATEPGFLYVHGADICRRPRMETAWSNRCAACRAKWPNDDTCATNGAAGSFAYLYDELKDTVSSVRNPETGYDAARDLLFLAVGPNYGDYSEDDAEWAYHVDYFRNFSLALRNRDIALMLREQYVGDDGKPRLRQMKEAIGSNTRLAVIEFCAGDGYHNTTPATGEMALTRYFDGCDIVIAAGGNAFGEPRQALWAEYEWNPQGSAFAWDVCPKSCRQTRDLYDDLSNGRVLPEPIFRDGDGLLSIVCRKLYGDEAGAMVSRFLPPEHIGGSGRDNSAAIILPLSSERLPGSNFSRFRFLRGKRELRWREDLDDWDMHAIRSEIACARASVAKTRAAAVGFRQAADVCEARRDSLLRMAVACETAVELGDLTILWLDLMTRQYACRKGRSASSNLAADLFRLEAEARKLRLRFEAEKAKMVDASGGQAHDAWASAEYLVREAENMRTTLETGRFPPHSNPSWW